MSHLVQPTRILVVGKGGREHALAWKLAAEPGVNEVMVVPGTHVVGKMARVRGGPAIDVLGASRVVEIARSFSAELVVIGPEAALAAGVADALIEAGIAVFGPTAAAARIESSKGFCREVAEAAGVPVAGGRAFPQTDPSAGLAYAMGLDRAGRVVVKADGLAAGKGVSVCDSVDEAADAISRQTGAFVVEERLHGREASVIALCDGRAAVALPISRDHKRLGDGDTGPNTGGMGAYSPLPDLPDDEADAILDTFHRPVLAELERRGTPFRGALYAGLMLTDDGPRLLEFNARFGDPETQVILPRLATPLAPWLLAAARGSLGSSAALPVLPGATVGIVLASESYPGEADEGSVPGRITALDDDGTLPDAPGVLVFHSGAFHELPGNYLATGGRILTVVGQGADIAAARAVAERAADRIAWPGMQRRRDVGLVAPQPAGAAL